MSQEAYGLPQSGDGGVRSGPVGGFAMRSYARGGLLALGTAMVMLVAASPSWAAGPVLTNPANWTPQMVAPAGAGYVRQLTPCGQNMYAVGTFSQFRSPADGGAVFTRNNAMSFNGTTGRMTAFNPNTDGIVNSIALDPADCSTAYIGGKFSTVGGQPATNLAAVDTATGALRTGFKHTATGQVSALVFTHGRCWSAATSTRSTGSTGPSWPASTRSPARRTTT